MFLLLAGFLAAPLCTFMFILRSICDVASGTFSPHSSAFFSNTKHGVALSLRQPFSFGQTFGHFYSDASSFLEHNILFRSFLLVPIPMVLCYYVFYIANRVNAVRLKQT